MRTHGRSQKTQEVSIVSELSCLNVNSVRAKRLFAIRYPNIAIKSLCSNLDTASTTMLVPIFS